MSVQEKTTLDLLNGSRARGDWDPGFARKLVSNAVTTYIDLPGAREVWDWDSIECFIEGELRSASQCSAKLFGLQYARDVVGRVVPYLKSCMIDCWLVIPLNDSHDCRSFRGRRFQVIGGSRKNKLEKLRKLVGLPRKEMGERARHTECSRSDGFYERPLLSLPFTQHHDWIARNANRLALVATCCMRVVYYAAGEPIPSGLGWIRANSETMHRGIAVHMLLHMNSGAWGHRPLEFETRVTRNLTWLNIRKRLNSYDALLGEFVFRTSGADSLHDRFLRALRFFSKSVNVSEEPFEGLGQSFMFLMIALETLLLRSQGSIRARMAVILSRLDSSRGVSRKAVAQAVEEAYRWRCDYVHDGIDVYATHFFDDVDFGGPRRAPPEEDKLKLLRTVTSRLLLAAPRILARLRGEALANGITGNDATEKAWFDELDFIWDKAIGLR